MCKKIRFTSFSDQEIYSAIYQASRSGSYVSYLRGKRCNTEDNFFREISASFQFPCYFGENWAAMDECLCDLEWLNISSVFIVVDGFHDTFRDHGRLKEMLQHRLHDYLHEMINYWDAENIAVDVWLNN